MRRFLTRTMALAACAAAGLWAQGTAPLSITTTPPLPAATIGTLYTETLAATGGTEPYTWLIVQGEGTLPLPLVLDPASGTISGTPNLAALTSTFTVQVTDSEIPANTATAQFTIQVGVGITTVSPLPTGTVGVSYAQQLTPVGGNGQYTWSLNKGALPTVLALDPASGIISGIPNVAGSSMFVIQLSDSDQLTTIKQFTLNINPALLITAISPLATGTVGVNYSQALQATGGSGMYTWAVSAGTLPPGLSLNPTSGVISGIPLAPANTANFTIQVTDSNLAMAAAVFALTIDPALSITTSQLSDGTVGVNYSQTLTATGGSGTYTWSVSVGALPPNLSLNATTGVISGQPTPPAGATTFTILVTDSNQATASKQFSLTIHPGLSITTASLPPGDIGANYSHTLTASGGSGTYTWSVSAGSLPAGLLLAAATGLISGSPTGPAGGTTFTILVTDSDQVTASKQFTITIDPALSITTNSPLPPGTVGISYSATLAATGGSGPYTWVVSAGSLPANLSLNPSTGVISGIPNTAATASFTIQVTDATQASTTKPFTLTINQQLNITTSSPLANAIVGVAYDQTLAGSGGALPYTWALATGALPGGLALAPSTGVISGTPNAVGTFQFTIQLTDSTNPKNSISKQFVITVSSGLTITTQPALPNATVGVAYSVTLTAAGGAPPYTWSITLGSLPAPLSLNSSTGQITGTPSAAVTGQTFTVKVTDSAPSSATQVFTLTVVTPPIITTASPLPNGTVGASYAVNLAGSGGTAPYKWTIASGALPAGLLLSTAGAITGIPAAPGAASFKVQLTDGTGVTASQTFSLTIVNGLTISTKSPLPTGETNINYAQTLTATGGTSPYQWTVTGGALPAGLSLATNGSISGKPSSAGTFSFTVQVADSTALTASAAFTVTIAAALSISTPSALASGSVGSGYSQTLTANAGVSPYSWSIASGSLPHGLTLSAAGVISGVPTAIGTSAFTAKVTDALGATASSAFTIVIVNGLTISTPSTLPAATVNVSYSAILQAAGGSGSYTWTTTAGSLPVGITLGVTGTLAGIPTSVGTATFTVQVTDSLGHKATEQMSLTVASALTITTSALPGTTVGANYTQALTAAGGIAPYTWSLLNGGLPGGLTLSAGGSISGVPSAAGTSSFTVKVTDSAGVIAIKQLSINVAGGISITTAAALPNASLNSNYSQSLSATGGTVPYTWTVTAGALPGGIQLSGAGALTGTPTASGTFQFTATVTDSAAASASEQFTLVVSGVLTITPATLPNGTIGEPYSQTLTATGGKSPYTFAIASGVLPGGLALKGAVISGTPATKGTYQFTIQATDSSSASGTQAYTIVIAALGILTSSPLPAAAVGTPYSQTLTASGTKPYTWAITQGTLPAGLSLDKSSGIISGTPTAAVTSTVNVQVTDSTKATITQQFSLTVIAASFSGISSTSTSAQQLTGSFALGSQYPVAITGDITLTFQPDASITSPADDPAIQFSTGGLTASFTIPQNSTSALPFAFQTGTIAGTITLTVTWHQADNGTSLAVPAALTQTIQIDPAVPVISAISASSTSSGFQVLITGYSNTREVSQAVVQFTPASGQTLQTTTLTVPLSSAAATYFGSSSNDQYGSQFILTLPFNVTGGSAGAIGNVSVQLANTKGASNPASTTLQ